MSAPTPPGSRRPSFDDGYVSQPFTLAGAIARRALLSYMIQLQWYWAYDRRALDCSAAPPPAHG
jgi:hypothetical protein